MYSEIPTAALTLSEILNYFFGSTTIVSIYIAWRSRKSDIKKAEASALETIQTVYDKFVTDTDRKIDELKTEIVALRHQVREYQEKCSKCPTR